MILRYMTITCMYARQNGGVCIAPIVPEGLIITRGLRVIYS